MIHPINIPEDLLATNPERPPFFRQRTCLKHRRNVVGYGADGRPFKAGGAPAGPSLQFDSLWKQAFLRSFIRRLAINPTEIDQKIEASPQHVDIVDLSPSPIGATSNKFEQFKVLFEEDEEEGQQQLVEESEKESVWRTRSIPDRPSVDTEEEEEEAQEGDQLARVGSSVRIASAFGSRDPQHQKVSRKAIRSILRRCCGGGGGTEFARFDFSQSNILVGAVDEKAAPMEDVEMVPELVGNRLWTQPATCSTRPNIRFSVASVRFQPGKQIRIAMVAHRDNGDNGANDDGPTLQIAIHVHAAQEGRIGKCCKVVEQEEQLQQKKTQFVISIELDDRIRTELGKKSENFLLVTAHGKLDKKKHGVGTDRQQTTKC